MGIRDTKMEAELEKNIIDYLQENQGYRYIKADEMKLAFNRKYALDEVRLLEFIEKSQPCVFKELNAIGVDLRDVALVARLKVKKKVFLNS